MLKNLLKISLRNLVKDKGYTSLNVLGLAIGITCSLFLLLYIIDELSYDRYHRKAANIYRLVSNIQEPDNAFTWAAVQMPLADELKDNYPEVLNAVRFFSMQRDLFKVGDKEHYESQFYFTDSTVFDTFSYEFIAGDPATALDQPLSIVLTEKTARKYFGDPASALDNTIHAERRQEDYKITGIIRDVPLNSHFRFDALMSKSSRPQFQGSWGGFGITTYVELPPGYDPVKLQPVLDKVVKEKVNPIFEKIGVKVQYGLQRITDIHLYSKIQDEAEANGDISYIYIFGSVAAFMLLIACINYMNLATARSAGRAKEVGLRKVMGSQRIQLMTQFLTESVIVSLASLTIGLILVYILLPAFNTFTSKEITLSYLLKPQVMLSIGGMILVTGILGGSYPAFYLSGFNPVNVLKGKVTASGGGRFFRRSLVVVQFGLSIFMLISTWIVFDQLQFLREKDLGFDKENVLRLNLSNQAMMKQGEVLAERLRQLPEILAVGKSDASPGDGIGKALMQVEDADGKMVDRGVDLYSADFQYVSTLGMEIVRGRNFSKDNPSDTTYAILVNESMVKRMNWKDPIGKRFQAGSGPGSFEKKVVGVIKDYNQNSLYDAIEPLIIVLAKDQNCNYMFVRFSKGDVSTRLNDIQRVWSEIFPNNPFEYAFLDEDLDSQYKADQKRSRIFTAFSMLTMVIACLGLLGLAAYSTEQRTREIGVRKVIGAGIGNLVRLMAGEFLVLVLIGMIVAFPAAWYFTNQWLQNFTYRIQLNGEWLTFLLSALAATMITLLTVGYHVVKTAMANPVESLRVE